MKNKNTQNLMEPAENQRTNSLYQVTLINIDFWGTPSVSGLGVIFEIPGICCF